MNISKFNEFFRMLNEAVEIPILDIVVDDNGLVYNGQQAELFKGRVERLKEKIKIDTWASDTNYNKFLIEYLQMEDPHDAIHRSVETCIELSTDQNIQQHDVLRYGNRNVERS